MDIAGLRTLLVEVISREPNNLVLKCDDDGRRFEYRITCMEEFGEFISLMESEYTHVFVSRLRLFSTFLDDYIKSLGLEYPDYIESLKTTYAIKLDKVTFISFATLFPKENSADIDKMASGYSVLLAHGYNGSQYALGSLCMKTFFEMFPRHKVSLEYPNCKDNRLEEIWRSAHRYGTLWSDEDKTRVELQNICHIDVNSMYPHIFRNIKLPCGKSYHQSKYVEVDPTDHYAIYDITIKGLRLKEGKIPFLRDAPWKTEPLYYAGIFTAYVGLHDFNRIKEYYDYDELRVYHSWVWVAKKTKFQSYVDKYFKLKSETKNVMEKQLAKFYLNIIIGKFGQGREYVVSERSERRRSHSRTNQWRFVPMTVAVADWGNKILLDMVDLLGPESVVYVDTDGIFFDRTLADTTKLKTGNELGDWRVEGENGKMIIYSGKRYIYESELGLDVAMAGAPKDQFEGKSFDDIKYNDTIMQNKIYRSDFGAYERLESAKI